jgi:hypothetical protein
MTKLGSKVIEWREKTGLTSQMPLRMIKMIVPICKTCPQRPGWWDTCPHDPYHQMQAIEDPQGQFVKQEDGTFVRDEGPPKIVGYRRVPIVLQVPCTIRISSGLEVVRRLAMGAKFPHELEDDGQTYADMCEFQNCYAANPTVKANHSAMLSQNNMVPQALHTGHYCTDRHARLAKRRDSENLREVYKEEKVAAEISAVTL